MTTHHSLRKNQIGHLVIIIVTLFFSFGVLSSRVHADITSGLVGHWTFDEGTSTTAADTSGNSNIGTLHGGATWTAGHVGSNALNFDGSSGYVDVTPSSSLDIQSKTVTLSAWVKPNFTSSLQRIIAFPTDGVQGTEKYSLLLSNGQAQMFIFQSFASAPFTDTSLWHHVVGVYDGTNMTVYVDNVAGTSTAYSQNILPNNVSNFSIGRFSSNFPQLFYGQIDDVRVYNRALSASDVSLLYDIVPPTFSAVASSTTATSSTITWTTNENADSQVDYGLTSSYTASSTLNTATSTSHSVTLLSLSPNTIYHFRLRSTDPSGNLATSTDFTFKTLADTTAPRVTLTVPVNGATVSGASVTLTATSSDDIAVTGVQFNVDGTNVGSSGSTSPYSIAWDSTSVIDGSHTIKAVAHDAALNYATSTITVTVSNTVPTPTPATPFVPGGGKMNISYLLPPGYAGSPGSAGTKLSFTTSVPVLSLGSSGVNVKTLQIFLNANGFTVSDTGAGSKGNETNYFGAKTKLALMKFQTAYKNEVLVPANVANATGILGKYTLMKIKALMSIQSYY